MRIDLFKCVGWATIISGLFLCLYVGYYLIYPFKVTDISLPLPVKNASEIHPGGVVVLEVGYTRYIEGMATIYSHFNCDSGIYSLQDRSSFVSKGSGKIFTRIMLPAGVPIGDSCTYQAINQYKVHELRSVSVRVWSEPFKVLK